MESNLAFSGKTVVITGATAGIGYRTALEFCRRGAFVIGVGRSPDRCQKAREEIIKEVPKAKVHFLIVDLSSQEEVRGLAASVASLLKENRLAGLDVLVNNAGLFMDKLVMTEDGIETTVAVNHIAPFLLTYLLLPLLQNQRSGGRSWLEHGITEEQVANNALNIRPGSEALWRYAGTVIERAVSEGNLPRA